MAKVPIIKRAAPAPTTKVGPNPADCCGVCTFRNHAAFEGAVKIDCLLNPLPVVKRVTDWCGQFQPDKDVSPAFTVQVNPVAE